MKLIDSISFTVYFRLFLYSTKFFNTLPFAKPFFRMLFLFILLKILLFNGILFLDEFQQAVPQFYPPTEGGFTQPPAPTPPPESSGLGLIPEAQGEGDGDRPNSNNYPSGASQEAHKDQASTSNTAPTGSPHTNLTTQPDERAQMEPPLPQAPPTPPHGTTPPNPPKEGSRSPAKEIMLSGAKGIAKEVGKCLCQGGQELLSTCLDCSESQ